MGVRLQTRRQRAGGQEYQEGLSSIGPLPAHCGSRGGESFLVRGWMLTQNHKTYVPLDTRKTHTLILDDNDDGDAVANMLRGGAGADGGRRKAASRGHCLSEGLGYDMHVYRQQVRVPRSLGARARSRPFAPSSLPLAVPSELRLEI